MSPTLLPKNWLVKTPQCLCQQIEEAWSQSPHPTLDVEPFFYALYIRNRETVCMKMLDNGKMKVETI